MRKDRGSRVLRRDKRRGVAGDRDKGPRQLENRTSPPQDGRRNCGSGGSRAGERTGADVGGAARGSRIGIPPDQVGEQEVSQGVDCRYISMVRRQARSDQRRLHLCFIVV